MRRTALALIAALIFAAPAGAGTISRLYEFEADTPIVADELNAELDNIISTVNGNLDSSNIAQNAIATGNIATAAVTTAKIASGSVTYVKLGPLNRATSNTTLTQFFSSQTEVQAEGVSVSVITSGRPIMVRLAPVRYLPGRVLVQHNGGGATDNASYLNIRRNGSNAGLFPIGQRTTSAGGIVAYPCSAFSFVDHPDGGVAQIYTLWARVATSDSGIVRIENCQLDLFEL